MPKLIVAVHFAYLVKDIDIQEKDIQDINIWDIVICKMLHLLMANSYFYIPILIFMAHSEYLANVKTASEGFHE